jgi:UDP-glucose 4-epimerase
VIGTRSPAPTTWIIGRGLLGSAVALAGAADGAGTAYVTDEPIAWHRPERATSTLDRNVAAFLDLADGIGRPWRILWCAGAGVVATAPELLERESVTFAAFLDRASRLLDRRPGLAARGTLFLASSAGGVYAASPSRPPFRESSPVAAMSAYGEEKLAQEHAATAMAGAAGVSLLIGRISNLYGPGQDLGKPQGLLGHVGKCALLRRPVGIYVPLDTIRDYLYAADAGRMVIDACDRIAEPEQSPTRRSVVKIFASEVDTSVAAVLSSWRRSLHRPLGVVIGSQPTGRLQPRTLSFRSEVWPDLRGTPKPLLEGIGVLLADQLGQLRAGTLAGAARS